MVASVVILCSSILLAALYMALTGRLLGMPSSTVTANFSDITGLSPNARVKFAGADVGFISSIKILTPEERKSLTDPSMAIQVRIALRPNAPPIPSDSIASVSSDTILSDKFLLIDGGTPTSPPLEDGGILASVAPVTFDKLLRQLDHTISAVDGVMGGAGGSAESLFADARTALKDAQALIADARLVVGEIKPLIEGLQTTGQDVRGLLAENREPLRRALSGLETTTASLEALVRRSNNLLTRNERSIDQSLANLRTSTADLTITMENAKVATTFARFLLWRLARNPAQLLWGTRPPPALPSEEEILSTNKWIPVEGARSR
ncbi:MAG: hypothetical protein Fur0032_18410 [Terrimicrobiaceae bacterium]